MKFLFLLASCLAISWAAPSDSEHWSAFKIQHGKSYQDQDEDNYRRSVFMNNLKVIEEHNSNYAAGLVSYKMAMNHFGDLLAEEFSAIMNGFNGTAQPQGHLLLRGQNYQPPGDIELPNSVDWREEGAVTPVKNQGSCGGCWAFSATGSLEGQLFKKTGELVALSEQQLIDCSGWYGNKGCQGGIMENAFNYIKAVGGLESEESYSYEGEDGYCKFKRHSAVGGTSVKSYVRLEQGNEQALLSAVAEVGPISVAVSGGNNGWRFYSGGVFDGNTCNPSQPDHGVLVVGYGTENGQDYWIVKNSWTSQWGEEGYMKLERRGNICAITTDATYPVL